MVVFANKKLNEGMVLGAGLMLGVMAVGALVTIVSTYVKNPLPITQMARGLAATGGSALANRISYIQPDFNYNNIKGMSFMAASPNRIGIRSI